MAIHNMEGIEFCSKLQEIQTVKALKQNNHLAVSHVPIHMTTTQRKSRGYCLTGRIIAAGSSFLPHPKQALSTSKITFNGKDYR